MSMYAFPCHSHDSTRLVRLGDFSIEDLLAGPLTESDMVVIPIRARGVRNPGHTP